MRMNPGYLLIIGWISTMGVTAEGTESAPSPSSPTAKKLIVATRHVPPFAIQADDGSWRGISVDLWRDVAQEVGVSYTFEPVELDDMVPGVADGRFDAAVAALTMTAAREQMVDFTHPFYNSGLAIAVPGKPMSGPARLLQRLISLDFLQAVAGLALLLIAIGMLVWIFERRRNAEQFGGSVTKGIGAGFWWSAVTMTTVGYGDKAPATLGGRLVALVWMFASVIIISSFTAAIASSLTVSQLATGIAGPEDLPGRRVGTVDGSTSEAFLWDKRARVRRFADLDDALTALAQGQVEAVVYDEPVLRYSVNNLDDADLRVLPRVFETQNYAIALPHNSPYREAVNQLVLDYTTSEKWQDTLYTYLGD